MESKDINQMTTAKKKSRPTQMLYVPPAQRNKRYNNGTMYNVVITNDIIISCRQNSKTIEDKVTSVESTENMPCNKFDEEIDIVEVCT